MSDTVPPKALVLRTWAFSLCAGKASLHRLNQAKALQRGGTDADLYLRWHASRLGDPLAQEPRAGLWVRLARIGESHAAHAAPLGGEATSSASEAAQPARQSLQTSRPKDGIVSDVAVAVRGQRN